MGPSTNRPEAVKAESQSEALIALLITEQSTWGEEESGVTGLELLAVHSCLSKVLELHCLERDQG